MNRPFFQLASSLFSRGSSVPAKRGRRGGAVHHPRRLGFEACESRRLLAVLSGVKFDTASDSGFTPGTDIPLGGVFIDLFKDDGDGVFDPAVDPMVDRQETAAGTGAYSFADVTDGLYFIQEEVPTGYTQSAGPPFYTVTVSNDVAFTGTATNVDNFDEPDPAATYFINAVDPNPTTITTTGTGMIGGQRDVTITVLGAPNPISASGFVGTDNGAGVFNLGSASNGPGTEVDLNYDANGAGLGADLTVDGNNGIRVNFNFLQVGTGTTMDAHFSLTGTGGGTATFDTSITADPGAFTFFVPFSSFTTAGGFSFANVASLQTSFNQDGVQDVDFEIDALENVHQQDTGFNFGNFPNISSISGHVYVDSNNNGNFDSGEAPISAVIVTLTGTDDLGQPVSQSTTTNTAGFYIFTNLRPGTYQLNETQPINFIDGKDTIGTPGGDTSNDMFSNIPLPAGFDGVQNNFGELGLTTTYATKRLLLLPLQPVVLTAVYNGTPGTPTQSQAQAAAMPAASPSAAQSHTATVATPAAKTAAVTTPVAKPVAVAPPAATPAKVVAPAKVATPAPVAKPVAIPSLSSIKKAASAPVVVAPKPAVVPKPVAAPVAKPVAVPVAKPVAVPVVKPVATPVAKPVVVAVAKPVAAPVAKPASTASAKAPVLAVAKPAVVPAAKPAVAPVAKPAVAVATKPVVAPAPTAKPAVTSASVAAAATSKATTTTTASKLVSLLASRWKW